MKKAKKAKKPSMYFLRARSAITGNFISMARAKAVPANSIVERVKRKARAIG